MKPKKQKSLEGNTIFHIAEHYIAEHYDFRLNEIKLDIECSPKGGNTFSVANEHSLYIELQKKGIAISVEKLVALLRSSFVPRYNPFAEYFSTLPKWVEERDEDCIGRLAAYVSAIHQEEFAYHFRKWLVRAVKCALVPGYVNKQALILVHNQQNSGKSTFCRFLCPSALSDYIAEDFVGGDKDSRILLGRNLLINLDELASLSKRDVNSLKSNFSKTFVNDRLPYDRRNSVMKRVCSFIGSTNMDEFLNDETGSVRWLCFRISSIKWAYKAEIDINKVWAQAYALSKSTSFQADLSPEDIFRNEERNREFQIQTIEKTLINRYLKKPDENKEAEFLSATEIAIYLHARSAYKVKPVVVGRTLCSLGFARLAQGDRYGYSVIKNEE
ncbi:MAG: hypothetical protein LBB79_09555 [Prevotellaceae bacterium]|jgi:predicted P-loop ATPase|nr:hypothetical protein [Prevotellaceae bacterium]